MLIVKPVKMVLEEEFPLTIWAKTYQWFDDDEEAKRELQMTAENSPPFLHPVKVNNMVVYYSLSEAQRYYTRYRLIGFTEDGTDLYPLQLEDDDITVAFDFRVTYIDEKVRAFVRRNWKRVQVYHHDDRLTERL